jgi:hypothetical protein
VAQIHRGHAQVDNIYWHDEMLGDTTYIETTTQEHLKTTTGNQGRNPAAIGLIFLGVAVRTMSAVARIEAPNSLQ